MSAKQWVAIDDADARIQYEGDWFSATPDQDINGLGNFGMPFQNTLHGINKSGNFTFTFTGSAVNALGTVRVSRIGGVQDPFFQCFLDGNPMGVNPPLLFPENNWSLCSTNGLAVGQHTLTVRATVDKMPFWLDRIQYVPASDSEFDKQLNYLENDHLSVQYDAGWSDLRGIGNVTHTFGAKATISFTGRSLAWYGLVPGAYPIAPAPATFSVDGGVPQNFLLNGLPSVGSMEQYNQLFFQTPQLAPGDHKLEVIYNGNSNQTPLTVDYFIVQREGAVANTDTSVPTPTSTSLSSSADPSNVPVIISSGSVIFQTQTVTSTTTPAASQPISASNKKTGPPVGAIVGGSIGGLVILAALGWLCVLFNCGPRRRFRTRQRLSRPGSRPPVRTPTLPAIYPASLRPERISAANLATTAGRASTTFPNVRLPPQHFQQTSQSPRQPSLPPSSNRVNSVSSNQDGRSMNFSAQARPTGLPPKNHNVPSSYVQDGRPINNPRQPPLNMRSNPLRPPQLPTSGIPQFVVPRFLVPYPPNATDRFPHDLKPLPRIIDNPRNPFTTMPPHASPSQSARARNPNNKPSNTEKGRPRSTVRQMQEQDGATGPLSPASMDGYNPPSQVEHLDGGIRINSEQSSDFPPRYSAS